MLVINQQQMDFFRQSAKGKFELEMVDHLAEFSPPLFKTLGVEKMLTAVRFGMARAESYGFSNRGPVRFYLEMMLLFGSHFDNDPQYPWANAILANQDRGGQMQRADWLYEKAMDYRKKVVGPDDVYAIEALRKIPLFACQPLEVTGNHFINDMLREIIQIYPQKAAYLGREPLETLIRKGLGGAQRQRFNTRGAALVVVLMLAFGHGCAADPLYPWIANTLREAPLATPEEKAQRLEKKALLWLEHVVANFAEAHPQ